MSPILIANNYLFHMYCGISCHIAQANKFLCLQLLYLSYIPLLSFVRWWFGLQPLWLYGPIIGTVISAFLFFFIQIQVLHFTKFHFHVRSFNRTVIMNFFTLFYRTFSGLQINEQTIDLSLVPERLNYHLHKDCNFFPVICWYGIWPNLAPVYLKTLQRQEKSKKLEGFCRFSF